MKKKVVRNNFLSVSFLLGAFCGGCTHTTTFSEPAEKTKSLAPATSRNLENFVLEKELAYSKTSQAVCTAVGFLGAFFALGTLADDAVDKKSSKAGVVSGSLAVSGAGFICGKYFGFISERAEVYLNGAGVKIEF